MFFYKKSNQAFLVYHIFYTHVLEHISLRTNVGGMDKENFYFNSVTYLNDYDSNL